ncbi:MAG: carbohydrate ABC transporter permease [Spirochaetes bacterium]|nr:carbohydrate ABC transporter permease [Spirochaetota bacterium]
MTSRLFKTGTGKYIILLFTAGVFVVPLYMTLITAIKDPKDINLLTVWIPPGYININGFIEAIYKLGPNFKNSLILTVSATIISSLIGSINGYIFSKKRFPGSDIVFMFFIFGMFIPYEIILIPLFQMTKQLGLYGSIWGLVLAHVVYGIPIVTLLFRNYYDQIDNSILESAVIDGAGFVSLFYRIFLPLSIPCFVVVGIWQFTQIWNEFLWGVCLTKQESNPITVGLAKLAGGEAVKWNEPMAGAIIASLPVIFIFIVAGKYFIRGLLSGSIKE